MASCKDVLKKAVDYCMWLLLKKLYKGRELLKSLLMPINLCTHSRQKGIMQIILNGENPCIIRKHLLVRIDFKGTVAKSVMVGQIRMFFCSEATI